MTYKHCVFKKKDEEDIELLDDVGLGSGESVIHTHTLDR